MTFTYQNGKWTKDGKEVTAAEVRTATKTVKSGYMGGYLPLPDEPEARAAEMAQRVYENSNSVTAASNPNDIPLWRKGERKMYDGDSGDGIHTFAELFEIEDDLKHAYDY